MTESSSAKITNVSDEELDQVSGGATAEEMANASMAFHQAQADAAANRDA